MTQGTCKDWKVRQMVFHRAHEGEIEDWLQNKSYRVFEMTDGELVAEVVRHFHEDITELIYPAKSYMVAIVYARMLERHFAENFAEALNDPDLLLGLDPWFKAYDSHPSVYDAVLAQVSGLGKEPWQVRETQRYFRQEFMLDSEK